MRIIKIILTILLLLFLFSMPYGFYNLVRFASLIVFALIAYDYYTKNQKALAITFGALALLFQPFFTIAQGRGLWATGDVVVATLLIILLVKERQKLHNH